MIRIFCKRQLCLRSAVSAAAVLLGALNVLGQGLPDTMSTAQQLLAGYKQSTNAIARAENVKQVAGMVRHAHGSLNATNLQLLDAGLHDPSITVVREAVLQAGAAHATVLVDTLAAMYATAKERWPGSATQMRCRILESLGRLSCPVGRETIATVLIAGKPGDLGDAALTAALLSGDATLVQELSCYRDSLGCALARIEDKAENWSERRQCQTAMMRTEDAIAALKRLSERRP